MVSYSTWVSIVRSEAGRQGADLSDFETNSDVMSVAGDIWNDQKGLLQEASKNRAEDVARSEVNVS